jgi:hypothetical protein
VSDGIPGERYFATRGRVTALLQGILDLTRQSGATPGETLLDFQSGLGKPFRVIVCGEVNAGKSTLLNALFGHPLCPSGPLPVTTRIHHYRHAPEPRENTIDGSLSEIFRPPGFLRDFELIDAPGVNDGNAEHLAKWESLAADADLLLCVFPVSNPWMAATWDLVGRLPAEALDRTALVIQQADLREPGDIGVILGHVADLSRKRLGRELPAFAVAARIALDAKRAMPRDVAALRESGLPRLEAFISENICQSPARRALLEEWRGHAATALRSLDDHIEDHHRVINGHGRFISGIDGEIAEIREEFLTRLPGHLFNVAAVFEKEAEGVGRLLHRRLRAFPSFLRLFTGDRTGQQMEAAFIDRLRETIEAVAAKDGGEVVSSCTAHWSDLADRVGEAMDFDLRATAPVDRPLAEARDRFVRRLGAAAGQGVGELKVRKRLDKDLRRRNLALRSFTVSTLLFLTAGAVCGALAVPWAPWILCGLAALFLAGGTVVAWITRRTITREFRSHLLDTCGAFAAALHGDYADALGDVFRVYNQSLDPLHRHLAEARLSIEPLLRRWQELFLTLKAIEQDW